MPRDVAQRLLLSCKSLLVLNGEGGGTNLGTLEFEHTGFVQGATSPPEGRRSVAESTP